MSLPPACSGDFGVKVSSQGESERTRLGAQPGRYHVTCSQLLRLATLEGIQKMLACPVQEKEPITNKMLDELIRDTNKQNSLSNFHIATACLLSCEFSVF